MIGKRSSTCGLKRIDKKYQLREKKRKEKDLGVVLLTKIEMPIVPLSNKF